MVRREGWFSSRLKIGPKCMGNLKQQTFLEDNFPLRAEFLPKWRSHFTKLDLLQSDFKHEKGKHAKLFMGIYYDFCPL